MEYSSSNPPPLVDLTKPTNQSTPNVSASSKRSKNDATNTVNTTNTITSTGMSRAHPVAIAVNALHKQANSPAALSPVGKQQGNKNLTSKLNSEMLIIPTTSPPGPTSISKQFSDISPSISLTALNNAPTLTPINTNHQHSKNMNKQQPLNSPTSLPLANGKTIMKSNITTTKSLTNQVNTPPKIKVANFATLSRQTNSASPANNNNINMNSTATNNGTHAKFANMKSTDATAAITTTTTTNTTTAAVNKRSAYPPLANLSYTNQKKPNATSTTLTPAQLQRLRAFGSQAASGSAAVRNSNEISIRPMDSKVTTAAGDNVYIIETNINDKRVAIGAPTRSGNGTTVTKVTAPAKRKNVDVLQMERKKQR